MRELVARSWERSAAAGLDADTAEAPFLYERAELRERREDHPLAAVVPLLDDVVGRAAAASDAVMAVGDADSLLLWVSGSGEAMRGAERIRFVEGARWDEALVGTNAPGTAVTLDEAVQVGTIEHFAIEHKRWSCVAAPIHHPVSGDILGVVDVTGGRDLESPHALAMVRAGARMAESELARLMMVGSLRGSAPLPPSDRVRVEVSALGSADCRVETAHGTVRLSGRHSEIMCVLAEHPEGVAGDRLALEVYGDEVRPSTVRAEMVRFRAHLGPDLVESRPYRLRADVRCDWLDVADALRAHRVVDAVRLYPGPLLPNSDAPGIVLRRSRLERELRSAVLASPDPDPSVAWTRSHWGIDDLEIWEHLLRILPESSPLSVLSLGEVQRLRIEFGIHDPTRGVGRALRGAY